MSWYQAWFLFQQPLKSPFLCAVCGATEVAPFQNQAKLTYYRTLPKYTGRKLRLKHWNHTEDQAIQLFGCNVPESAWRAIYRSQRETYLEALLLSRRRA